MKETIIMNRIFAACIILFVSLAWMPFSAIGAPENAPVRQGGWVMEIVICVAETDAPLREAFSSCGSSSRLEQQVSQELPVRHDVTSSSRTGARNVSRTTTTGKRWLPDHVIQVPAYLHLHNEEQV